MDSHKYYLLNDNIRLYSLFNTLEEEEVMISKNKNNLIVKLKAFPRIKPDNVDLIRSDN